MRYLYQYGTWLAILSLACFVAERIRPWREEQPWRRPQLLQDVLWLLFNGYLLHLVFGPLFALAASSIDRATVALTGGAASDIGFLAPLPLALQALAALVLGDFIEWCVHNLLHRTSWLWRIHRVHHSIRQMDWIGNFRFHWGEVLVYQAVKYLPLTAAGASWQALLITAVISTAIGHLNHANLDLSYGPLRYLLNSPRMHIWHHDKQPDNTVGYNFAVVFSFWDWLFHTAHLPPHPPRALGFVGEERVPEQIWWRFLLPFVDRRTAGGDA